MKGKIFGIPLVLILLLIAILLPTLYMDYVILNNLDRSSERVAATCIQAQAPEAVATPSATPVVVTQAPVRRVLTNPVVSPSIVK